MFVIHVGKIWCLKYFCKMSKVAARPDIRDDQVWNIWVWKYFFRKTEYNSVTSKSHDSKDTYILLGVMFIQM